MPSNQHKIIEQAKFTYSPLGKAFEKQTKTIEDQGKKQIDALEFLKPSHKQLPLIRYFISKERLNAEIINEMERIEEEEKKRPIEIKWFIKHLRKPMILENLEQYLFFVMKLEIILSI